MSEQQLVNTPAPDIHVPNNEPMVSLQSQIGLVLTATASVIAFVFHKDYSPIVPAVTTVSFAVYGAAVAISRAIKHRTLVVASMQAQSLRLDTWSTQRRDTLASNVVLLEQRLRAIESATKRPAAKKTTARRGSGSGSRVV